MIKLESPEDLRRLMGADFAPSDEQWAAITAPLTPSVVIAGAGSGKTTLMAARVVYLVATGQVRPEQVLGLTFTAKAASELRQRVLAALTDAGLLTTASADPASATGPTDLTDPADPEAEEVLEPTVSTYHAYAASLLADHGLRIGHEPDTRVLADASRYQLAGRVIAAHEGRVDSLTDHPPTAIAQLLALDGQMSEHLVTPQTVLDYDDHQRTLFLRELEIKPTLAIKEAIATIDKRRELMDLVLGYRALKARLGLMDFGDQIELAARLAEQCPEVGQHERERFRVVLLDEYQDTSAAQATMLSRLFSGREVGDGPEGGLGHAVTAVGDPNQAIYGWRGASVHNILHFTEVFPTADGREVRLPLTINRRSDRRILAVANDLAEPLLAAHAGKVAQLAVPEGAAEGVVEVHCFDHVSLELDWLADAVRDAHCDDVEWRDVAVLTRTNADSALVYDALTAADVPVEIVGLSGLIRLPEVAEVVAVLHLMADITHNASLLTLLTGPRWAIGPRDLVLLGRRAVELAGSSTSDDQTLQGQLTALADGVDPAEIPALIDALESPGDADYSREALVRFDLLAGELRHLRAFTAEPLLDIVRRIIDVTGVDVELASATAESASARRDNLDLFVKAVADFQAVDGHVSLHALLAYLGAEDDFGNGLDVATPTEADSVKLLTVHRAKGLEWHTVFLMGVSTTKFPTNKGRSLWVTSPKVLPSALRGDAEFVPQLRGHAAVDITKFRNETKAADLEEERRLGYVAFTRAAHRMVITSHVWADGKKPRGPSEFQELTREHLARHCGTTPEHWSQTPAAGAENPFAAAAQSLVAWPRHDLGPEIRRRRFAAELVQTADPDATDEGLDLIEQSLLAQWDAEIERLLTEVQEATAPVMTVPLPSSMSATSLVRLANDPERLAAEWARPMPRPPAPQAAFGTRFHEWVEQRFGQQRLLDLDDLSGRAESDAVDDADLTALIDAFEAGPFADLMPHTLEAPFSLVLAGQVIRGRIDAVYQRDDGRWLLVDWKTSRSHTADPLQLAIYRLAWAELQGVDPAEIEVAFHYVRDGATVTPTDLAGRAQLEALLTALKLPEPP